MTAVSRELAVSRSAGLSLKQQISLGRRHAAVTNTLAAIAAELNSRKIKTARGGEWHLATVRHEYRRAKSVRSLVRGANVARRNTKRSPIAVWTPAAA